MCEIIKRNYCEKVKNYKIMSIVNRLNAMRLLIESFSYTLYVRDRDENTSKREDEIKRISKILQKIRKKEEDLIFSYRINTGFFEEDIPF